VTNSPFDAVGKLPSKELSAVDDIATTVVSYELVGIFITNGAKIFNIRTPHDNQYRWIKEGSEEGEIIVDSFDFTAKTLHFHTRTGERHSIRLNNFVSNLSDVGVAIK
jgi:hypothetical protein